VVVWRSIRPWSFSAQDAFWLGWARLLRRRPGSSPALVLDPAG